MAKHQVLQGLIVGSRAHQAEMVRGMETTGLKPILDRAFPLQDLADAFRHEESGAHFGKIVVQI